MKLYTKEVYHMEIYMKKNNYSSIPPKGNNRTNRFSIDIFHKHDLVSSATPPKLLTRFL